MPTPILAINELTPTQVNKSNTINDMFVALEAATQDTLAVSMANGDVTLTPLQYTRAATFVCSGQPAAQNLVVPLTKRVFGVRNNGGYPVTVGGASGATVTVAAGAGSYVQCDGANCAVLVAGVAGSGGLASIPAGDLLANLGAASAVPSGVSLTSLLDSVFGATQGFVLYRGGSAWSALAPGTAGQVLSTGGATGNPSWVNASSGVSSVASGAGLTGGPVTASGTLSLAPVPSLDLLANLTGGNAPPGAVSLSALLDAALGAAPGDIVCRGASAWGVLAPGSFGQVLQSSGANTNPNWVWPTNGTVTSVMSGPGLSGGPITTAGTLAADWHAGVVSALGAGISLTSGTLAVSGGGTGGTGGTGWSGGTVTALDPTITLASGTLAAPGAVWLTPSTIGPTLSFPFAFSGKPAAGQVINVAMTQAVTVSPSASEIISVNQGTVTHANAQFRLDWVTASGTVTPIDFITVTPPYSFSFSETPSGGSYTLAAGDTLRITAPATQDTTLANLTITVRCVGVPPTTPGPVTSLASTLSLSGGVLSAPGAVWKVPGGEVDSVLSPGLSVFEHQLAAQWNAGLVNSLGSGLSIATGGTLAVIGGAALPINFNMAGKPAANQLFNHVLSVPGTLAANFAGTKAFCSTLPTANATFTLYKTSGGTATAIGTITLTPSSATACTLSTQAAVSLAAGDVLQMVAPATQDATLSDISISILGAKA